MTKYLVTKSGPLRGEIEISGSKNAVLPILAAAILSDGECEIMDVPELRDVEVMCQILSSVGVSLEIDYPKNTIRIMDTTITTSEPSCELVKKMRASFLVMGPLLAKTGKARISLPGGCAIGARPIDLHLKGFAALGAKIIIGDGFIEAKADKLVGGNIYLDFPSVGATESIIMTATLAEGHTIIENAAMEPEIVDLANFLNKMGAKIKGAGTSSIKIDGVVSLHGAKHAVIPDRVETGTFMVAAAITRGDILIKNVVSGHVKPIIAKLIECGVEITEDEDEGLRVRADRKELIATDIKTLPYPGFPTDMQSQFMALLTTVKGESIVIETVFENRFMHVKELNRMGASIQVDGKKAIITGGKKLKGAKVEATDLRAGAALVLAGLITEGVTEISEIYHIERGYSDFAEKLTKVGASIKRVTE
ncbi:MAG: UDP-N-acetylglucosamine 1-carboxyvinyltransferase [Eubacteriales bacterium]